MAEDEKKKYQVKPVQQDQWTKWCSYLCMDHLWKTLLAMPQQPLSFSLGATYDTLPSPSDLHYWDRGIMFFEKKKKKNKFVLLLIFLEHVLWPTFCHDCVLSVLVVALESFLPCKKCINAQSNNSSNLL